MLVILTDQQILSTEQICTNCLLADRAGSPRWQKGQLSCGQYLGKSVTNQADVYKCHMGFRVANIT